MSIFGQSFSKTIEKEYIFYSKRLNKDVINKIKGKGNPLAFYNSRLYKLFTASMFKALNTLEKGKSKEYYKYLNQSHGDYSKRKGGNIARSMAEYAGFIEDILDKNQNDLKYSLLSIFIDIFNILKDRSWVNAFSRAFSHVDKSGATNTIVTSFKMMYIALVIAFESIGLKLLALEYDLYTGTDAVKSTENIMTQHSSFMKSIVIPMIKIIVMCQNMKNPLSEVNEIIGNENKVKDAKRKASEAGYPYNPEENGLTTVESYKVKQLDNIAFSKSKEAAPLVVLSAVANGVLGAAGVSAGVSAVGAGTATSTAAIATGAVLSGGGIAIIIIAVILLIFAVPVARLVMYWVHVRKVDIQKELELQAELLANNIISLQEKLERATSEDERVRLQNIINKQVEMLVKLQEDIKKYLDDDYEASVAAEQLAEDDDSSRSSEDKDDNGFEVAI
jgi:hypothetical protein